MTTNHLMAALESIADAHADRDVLPEDYVDPGDGLLRCGRCGGEKEVRLVIFGETRVLPCLCECETERRDKEAAQEAARRRQMRIEALRSVAIPDAAMRGMTFANADMTSRAMRIARRYADRFDAMAERGKGLLLYGPVGTGKTYAAACIANALVDRGRACLMTNFMRIINTLSGLHDGRQEYIDRMADADLLVIDDLAAERDTEYAGEIVYNVIDTRYRSGRPVIITANLTADELKHPDNIRKSRIYSRLYEMTLPVECDGADRRRHKLVSDYADLLAELEGEEV